MSHARGNWSDQRIETIIGDLLRAGVLLAIAVTSIGALIYLAHSGNSSAHYKAFHGEPTELRTLKGVLKGTFSCQGNAIIQLGVLLLIATPVARVVFSVFAFAIQRDRLYAVITLVVLLILGFSLAGAHF